MKLAKYKVFSAHDMKLNVFMMPFFALHTGQILRQWEELVNDKNTVVGKHPLDFRLVQVGEYDDQTGKFENVSEPFQVAAPGEYLSSQQSSLPGLTPLSGPAETRARATV